MFIDSSEAFTKQEICVAWLTNVVAFVFGSSKQNKSEIFQMIPDWKSISLSAFFVVSIAVTSSLWVFFSNSVSEGSLPPNLKLLSENSPHDE